jgi:hypothetical protein
MPTAEGFRGSHARNGSQFLRGCRTRRKILCKSRGPAGVWTEFFRDLPTGGLEGYLAEASFSSLNWEEKHCIIISVAFRLYLVKIIQILTN